MSTEQRTYRERRLAKAERLREWADKRETKAAAVFEANEPHTRDWAFITQPGHIPARARIIAQEDRARESVAKADDMRRRADGIEAAADRAIYSDDPDAADRLTERIGELEAERDRIKRYNASCRKAAKAGGTGDLSILDDRQRQEIATLARVAPFQLRAGGAFPAYASSNLSGNIGRLRKRLEAMTEAGR